MRPFGFVKRKIKQWIKPLLPTPINNNYSTHLPAAQVAVDIFKGEWSSRFPKSAGDIEAGSVPLFEDPRIAWFGEQIGDFKGKTVLELGPLEGGHTYMLDRAGAAKVIAIESNSRAYLKCLIAKEIMGMPNGTFLHGDFLEYLRAPNCPAADICIMSGVLYHMRNPVELIELASRACKQHLLLWTHYYDPKFIADKQLTLQFPSARQATQGGFAHTLHRQEYLQSVANSKFCGGTAPHSEWISRDDILNALKHFGFSNLRISFDDFNNPGGPAFAVAASKG